MKKIKTKGNKYEGKTEGQNKREKEGNKTERMKEQGNN
jgi:hypothetical protein